MDVHAFFMRFKGHESTVAALARHMKRCGLSPDDVLAAYNEWLAARMAEMEPATPPGPAGHPPRRGGLGKAPSQRGLLSHFAGKSAQRTGGVPRSRPGDTAQIDRACPKCGGAVELEQKCPIESPRIRTVLACMNDACNWYGQSRLPLSALVADGAAAIADRSRVIEG